MISGNIARVSIKDHVSKYQFPYLHTTAPRHIEQTDPHYLLHRNYPNYDPKTITSKKNRPNPDTNNEK